jgi:hypothetical protein
MLRSNPRPYSSNSRPGYSPALVVASGLVWAVMFFGPIGHFSRLAGGASPFDIRPMGYSYDEAYAFLNAIGEQGRRYYEHSS